MIEKHASRPKTSGGVYESAIDDQISAGYERSVTRGQECNSFGDVYSFAKTFQWC